MPTYAQNIKIETKYANGIIFSEVDLPVYIVQYLGFYLCTFLGTVVPKRGGGGGGAGGQGGQYCPLHFSTIVTKQTLANLKARLSKAG